jgi:hypothetical protein
MRRPRQFPKKVEPQETSLAVTMKYLLNQKQVDDIDTFFPSMAATVGLFSPRQRVIAKSQVFSVISKLETEILSQQSPQPQRQHPLLPAHLPVATQVTAGALNHMARHKILKEIWTFLKKPRHKNKL